MLQAIGNTPLIKLQRIPGPDAAEIWLKLEGGNPTGSYKDRMALAMVEGLEQRGQLAPGMSLLECTGGSTGSSLAFVCAVKGYPFTVISSDAYAREEGVFAGTSTGMNALAALQLAQDIGPGGRVVTVACDTGFKYLDGPLFR